MTKKELRKLRRVDLLELLLEQSKEIDRLRNELADSQKMLNQREITINNAGSIADAVVQLNGIFDVAQDTANQYIDSLKRTFEQQDIALQKERELAKKEIEEMYKKAFADCRKIRETNSFQKYSVTINDNGVYEESIDTLDFDLNEDDISNFDYDIKEEDISNWDWDV